MSKPTADAQNRAQQFSGSRFSGATLRISLLALAACAASLPLYSLHRPSAANAAPDAGCGGGSLKIWDGEGGDDKWSTAANWCDNTVPNSGNTVVFDGTSNKNCTIDAGGPQGANINVEGFQINSGYTDTGPGTGIITQGSGVSVTVTSHCSQFAGKFVGSNGNITINGNFIFNGGTFTGGSGNINLKGNLNLSGDFTASSSTTSFGGQFGMAPGGMFHHHDGTVVFNGGDPGEIGANVIFNNLTFSKNHNVAVGFTSGTIVVTGTLTLADGIVNNSPIRAEGDVSIASTFDGGTAGLSFTGTANQTYTNPIDPPNAPGPNLENIWTVDKGGGTVNLGSNLDLSNSSQTLVLTNGTITTGTNIVNAGARTVTRTNGYIIGNLQRSFTSAGPKDFFVGTSNGFSPVSANLTSLAQHGTLTIGATQGSHPLLDASPSLGRYFPITEAKNLTANVTFSYLQSDVIGNESNYRVIKIQNGSANLNVPSVTIDTTANTFTVSGLQLPSDWTLGELPPGGLAFRTQPTNSYTNATIAPPVEVEIRDQFGNVDPSAANAVTLAIFSNPSGGTLSGTLTQNAVNGVAVFNNLSINNLGNGYTLIATSNGLASSASIPFNIVTPFLVFNTNNSGLGSLRQAIINANNTPGTQTISFNLAVNGEIRPDPELPPITDPVIIDGTTQPGYAGTPLIYLYGGYQCDIGGDCSNCSECVGLTIEAGNSTVKGLVIYNWSAGIILQGNGNNTILANSIGQGGTFEGNFAGIILSSNNNRIGGPSAIERNVICNIMVSASLPVTVAAM